MLESDGAELASIALFAAGGVWLAEALAPLVPAAPLAVVLTLLGPMGCGIERGRARRPGLGWSLLLGTAATLVHLGLLFGLRSAAPPALELLGRGLPLLILGTLLPLVATRLDRGEAGWRASVRLGPPTGSSPLAFRIAALRPPRPVGWLLLPFSLMLVIPCLVAILGYQLTLSRLMPPACRYEPSCSRYGFEAFRHHGFIRGGLLTSLRLVRCSPLGSGGYDPIPPGNPDGRSA